MTEGLPKENIAHDYSCCAKATSGSVLWISTGHERGTSGQAETLGVDIPLHVEPLREAHGF